MNCTCGGDGNGSISDACCVEGSRTAWLKKNPQPEKEIQLYCDEYCNAECPFHMVRETVYEIT